MNTREWEKDGDGCNDCGEPAAYDEATGWYYHIDPTAPTCFLMESGLTKRDSITINGVTFTSWPEHGAWYENEGGVGGVVGTLYAPMKQDGTFDVDEIGEIEVAYEDA